MAYPELLPDKTVLKKKTKFTRNLALRSTTLPEIDSHIDAFL